MSRKILFILLLAIGLSACGAQATPSPTPVGPTTAPTEVPTVVEPTDLPTEIPTEEALTPEPQLEPLIYTDDMGRTVELAGPAQRIVTLGPSSLESLFAIGAGAQIVGREEFSTYPDEALEITSVGSLWGELPTEAILALEPDLVIAPEIIAPEQIQTLEDLGLTIYFQANPVDFDGLWENLRALATLSGHEAEAAALITALGERVDAVVSKISAVESTPSVFYELDATDPQNPYTVGGGTMIDTLITMSGGANMGAVLEGQYAPISSEEIIAQNPEIILLADAPYGITPEVVAERAGWEAIAAVANGMVYEFDPFLVSVPGPRMVDGLEAMAQILHPEAFE
jgi:iron complex transport system substrate-binding protein